MDSGKNGTPVEFYSKQDQNSRMQIIPSGFSTFLASGRVRRPQRLPAAPVTLTQYPERYVVQRESSRNFRCRPEAAADLFFRSRNASKVKDSGRPAAGRVSIENPK